MEVNFKELKRKNLQRLCKKHGLRANATNSEMADSLASLFKICEKNRQGENFLDEKVVIFIDDDDDELVSVLQSKDSNVLRSKDSKKRRRISSKVEEACEPKEKENGSECQDLNLSINKSQEQAAEYGQAAMIASSSHTKTDESAPIALSERVDNALEKLFRLRKVLRGEIVPPITGDLRATRRLVYPGSLQSHPTTNIDMTTGESLSSHEPENQILNALMPADPESIGYEQDSSNSELNISNKIDEVAIISSPYACDFYIRPIAVEPCQDGDVNDREFLEIVQGVTTKPGEFLVDNKFVSSSMLSCSDLEGERSSSASCISKKSLDCSIPEADTFVDAVPSEVKASFNSKTIDPVEEIRCNLINFCVSSLPKAVKSNIVNTPITNSAGISSVELISDKENTQITKMKHTLKKKTWNSASAGSIRRPLQSFTNKMME